MIIEYADIHRKALNPRKKYQFFYHLGKCSELFVYMHTKQSNTYARVNLYEMSTNKLC